MQATAVVVVWALVAMGLTGCVASSPDIPRMDGILHLGTPAESELDARTLTEPPTLHLGQWWQYRYYHVRTGIDREVTLVVAGAENHSVLIGAASADFDDAIMVTHVPPIGLVDAATWGYDMHKRHFVPLQFPIRDGDTWETGWQNAADDVTASVMSVDGQTAHIEMIGATRHINLHYDARVSAITSLNVEGYGGFELLDSGYGFSGDVLVPYGYQPAILTSRVAGVTDGANNPVAPTQTIQVDGAFDQMSLLILTGPAGTGAPGIYALRIAAPDGTVYAHTAVPPESGGDTWSLYHATSVVGEWEATWAMAGPGVGFFEGIAYEARSLRLGPSGLA